jgi:predicted enzyme related to lactoylglutathione lyase
MSRLLINIDVDDLDKAVRFYTSAFDLRVGRRIGSATIELVGGEAPIYLLVKEAAAPPFAGAATSRDYQRHWTPVHLDFIVDDLEAAVRRAESAGAHREGEPSEHVWGRMALLSDPFGHGFCLLEFRGRGYDEAASESKSG